MALDPNAAAAADSGLFGLPFGPEDAHVHVLGVPFGATASYRQGTARAPEAILAASRQVDLYDLRFGRPYERGIWMAPTDLGIARWDEEARSVAAPILERGGAEAGDEASVRFVDERADAVADMVRAFFDERLLRERLPVLVGGDHSTPFGAILACSRQHAGLGVLQFDAHADLRPAYEGFRRSHASILANVLAEVDGVARLVQVGVRDLCEQEFDAIQGDDRVTAVLETELSDARLDGGVRELAERTIALLPDEVYVTFDVDALDPSLCPNTGTPVPGGLSWDEAMVWLEALARSGKRVVGMDLVEVSAGPGGDPHGTSWDAIVGARLLYRMIGAALSNG
ncbi:MAG: agmatinase family protein [Planctomycetota bacterium]